MQPCPAGEEASCVHLFFPHLGALHIDGVEDRGDSVVITARARAADAACHRCGMSSSRVNSRYRRRLHDSAAGGRAVIIDLQVRRFFCGNQACGLRTFTEQVPAVAPRHQRRTPLLRGLLETIALGLAGRAGARLARAFGVVISRSTLIRLIRSLPDPEIGRVTVLGVDDFAKRKGHSYATILIDMDTHRPIDILDDRLADTLAEWLKQHPGVEVICRDRAGAYAEGARVGAPDAVQVADRFHLWQNLCRAVEATVVTCRADLREPPPQPEPPDTGPNSDPVVAPTAEARQQPDGRLATRTRERHAAVHALLAEGRTHTEIRKILDLDDKTVRKFLRAATAEELISGPRSQSKRVDRFAPHLHERWNAGCTDAAVLHKEIRAQGYRGSERSVRRYLQPLRAAMTTSELPAPPPSVRDVTRWITCHPDNLATDDSAKLQGIAARSPHLSAVTGHVVAFAQMMACRRGKQDLEGWMAAVDTDDLPHLHSFTRGIRRDLQAVINGLSLEHNSGAVEGNVCRVKAIKRKMYGRANLDLLRKMVLLS